MSYIIQDNPKNDKSTNTRRLIFSILLLVLIIALVITVFSVPQEKYKNILDLFSEKKRFAWIVRNRKVALCGIFGKTFLGITDKKAACLGSIAFLDENPAVCDRIDSDDWRKSCLASVYIKKAKTTLDPTYCQKSEVYNSDSCLDEIVKRKNDPSICEFMKSRFEQELCKINFGILPDLGLRCDESSGQWDLNICQSGIAKMNNLELCDKIKGPSSERYIENCKNDYYFRRAKENNDLSYCGKSSACKLKVTEFQWEKNPDLCDQIVDANLQYKCYNYVASVKSDTRFCNKIPNLERRFDCLTSVEGLSACEFAVNPDARDQCYFAGLYSYTYHSM